MEAINSGKQLRVVAIDSWDDHEVKTAGETYGGDETYRQYLEAIRPVSDLVESMRMLSLDAANSFDDASCDFVFIDASHEYEDVLDDLRAWYPKVKPGGVIAGHDYHWPGVSRAVREFATRNGLKRPRNTELCWVIEVGAESRSTGQRFHDLVATPKEHLLSLTARMRYEVMTRRAGNSTRDSSLLE